MTRVRVQVTDVLGRTWESDIEDVTGSRLTNLREIVENVGELETLSMFVDRQTRGFNPRHIVTAALLVLDEGGQ